jgi:hypothetical protein
VVAVGAPVPPLPAHEPDPTVEAPAFVELETGKPFPPPNQRVREPGNGAGLIAALAFVVFLVVLVFALSARAQCPGQPGCGADPDIPRHFTLFDGTVSPGQTTTVELWVEKYEAAQEIHLRFELDPAVAEFVGALPGRDLRLIGPSGCWNLETRAWVRTPNEEPDHVGWQLNYFKLSNWCTINPCTPVEGLTGSIGAYRDLGLVARFHVADIIIRGNAVGETPIWIDRQCSGEPMGGQRPGPRDSFMSWYVENNCPGGNIPPVGGNDCVHDPDDPMPIFFVTLSNQFHPGPPAIAASGDAMIYVEDPTGARTQTWSMVKRLYQ